MSDSLFCDASGGGLAYVRWDPTPTKPVHITAQFYYTTTDLSTWHTDNGTFGPSLMQTRAGAGFEIDSADAEGAGSYSHWQGQNGEDVTTGFTSGWHEFQIDTDDTTGTLTIDGTPSSAATGFDTTTQHFRVGVAGGIATVYVGKIKAGTTPGGSDLVDYDPATDGAPGPFGFTVVQSGGGTVALAVAPTPPPAWLGAGPDPTTPTGVGGVRISVAFDDPTLEPDPVWTYLTFYENLTAGYSIDRGRQYEFDKTDTGTASITINDVDGILDPTNTAGPFYGLIEPLLQVQIELYDPVAETWTCRFRGFIEDYNYTIDPSQVVTRLEIECVDLFEILTAIEMQPDGSFGDTPPTEQTGNIFFDNATAQDRITQVLGNAGIPVDFYVVFTLNVDMQESTYSPSENALQVVQDAADAEFPTVSNVYCDRLGRLAVHGRLAKFDPTTTAGSAAPGAWNFTHWKAGDEAAVLASVSDTAQIRTLAFNRGLSKVFNSCMCTPNGIADTDIAGQLATDPTSIGQYGFRSWSAENLLIDTGTTTGNTGLVETHQFAIFIKERYKAPRNRIAEISFRSMSPSDPRAAANWALLCGADISDIIDVTETSPGGGGFTGDTWFIEGVHEEVQPLNGTYADVTLSLDLSPGDIFIGHGSGTGYDLDG